MDYYYKAKIYCNLDVNDFIVLKDVNENKIYIFNFDTNQQTQDFYDLLCKKVDKIGILHTESTTPPITKIHTIHCSESLNP